MILSIDFNPLLKRKYYLEDFDLKDENIPKNLVFGPGGDGIELGYFLHGLNEDVMIIGFLGGVNGSYIHKDLMEAGITHDFLPIRDESSDNIILSLDNGEEIIIREKAPRITRDEIVGFYQLYTEKINDSDMVCCSGNLPLNVPKEIFYDIISIGKKYSKKTLLGIKGEELIYGIESAPYLVLLNKNELENITRLSLDYESELIKAGLYVLEKGTSMVVIELGNKGSIVLTNEFIYRVEVPSVEIDHCKINYGYMLAGYALAIKRNYDIDMMLKLGQACGIVNCFRHREAIDMSDIKRIMGDMEVSTFNY